MAKNIRMRKRQSRGREYYEDDNGEDDIIRVVSPAAAAALSDPSEPTRRLVKEYINALRSELNPRFDAVDTRFDAIAEATKVAHEDFVRVPTDIQKATGNLQALIDIKIDAQQSGLDHVEETLSGLLETRHADIRHEVTHLQTLIFSELTGRDRVDDEIFKRIETQFIERDKRTEQLALASSTAIAAALQAQKEAAGATTDSILAVITKMDASFTKLFDQMANLLTAQQKNTDDKIADIKGRIDKREGRVEARDPALDETIHQMRDALDANRLVLEQNGRKTETIVAHKQGGDDSFKNIMILVMAGLAGLGLFLGLK